MKVKPLKIKIKSSTPSAADRLYTQQQKNRKAAGLPDPSEYKKKLDAMKSEETELGEGILKTVKRITQGWGHDPIGIGSKPKDIVKRNKSYDVDTAKKMRSTLDDAKPHTPAGLQKKVLDRKLKSEEVEQLDELSPQTKASYVAKAKEQIKQSVPFTKKGQEYRDIAKNFIAKRQKGIDKATKVEEGVTIGGMVGRGNIHQYDRNPGPKDGSELENVPFHAKTEKQKKLQNALNDLGNKMKETHPKLKEMNEGIHQQIKKHLDAGHNVHSKAVGRIGQITQAHSGGVQLKVKGRTAVTRFDKGDKVKLLKKSDTEYHVVNEDADPCWKGYKMVGMKNKNGRKVPNCVPGEGVPSMKKEGVQDDPKADQMTTDDQKFPKKMSRKAQIVKSMAKGKEEKFQANPVLDSDVNPQTNKQ